MNQQFFDRKPISRDSTHPQSLIKPSSTWHVMCLYTGVSQTARNGVW